MRISVSAGYWSAGPPPGAADLFETAERIGIDQIWTAEAYGSDAWTPLAWWGSRTSRVKLGTAVSQLSARPPGHDRDDHGPPGPGAGPARRRHQQPSGGGGLVRPAVSPAAPAHPGVHRDPPPGHRPRRAGPLRRPALPASPARRAGGHWPGQAAALDPAPLPHRDPHLPRCRRP